MAYCTIEDVKKALRQKAAVFEQKMSNEDLQEIVTNNEKVIDDYIGAAVTLPFEETPHIIKRICITLTKFDIYDQFASSQIPKNVQDQYDHSIKTLEKIAAKKIVLGTQKDADGNSLQASYTANTQLFNVRMP